MRMLGKTRSEEKKVGQRAFVEAKKKKKDYYKGTYKGTYIRTVIKGHI